MAMEDYKKKLGALAYKIKNESPHMPIQQVLPVKSRPLFAELVEACFNNWIPRSLKKKIKAYEVQHGISQKDITIQAYLYEYTFSKHWGNSPGHSRNTT